MFSDERELKCVLSRYCRWRRPSESSPYHSRFTVQTVCPTFRWRHNLGKFSVYLGLEGLFFLPKYTTRNGDRYINVLEEHFCDFYALHQCDYSMQSRAPSHRAKEVMKWLRDYDIRALEGLGTRRTLT